jgi:soluble lytic murein transglycosylase-like protein
MASGNSKGASMSATLTARKFLDRRTGAFLHYLHIDLATVGLALFFVIAGGLTANISLFAARDAARPYFAGPVATPAAARGAQTSASQLAPAMMAALDHVAQRYRVSAEALQPVFEAAQAAGREWRVDPLLIIAVISIESRFNPFSQSSMGAVGLMQIIPRYHQEKLPKAADNRAFLDPVINVHIGARILQESIQRQGGLMEGLQYYAGAIDDTEQTYATKVIAEKTRLEQASRRKDGPAA